MRKISMSVVILAVTAVTLTGCTNPMPDLSEEEYSVIAEYAAGEMMKYNTLNPDRIVSDTVIENELNKEEKFARNTEEYREKVRKEKAEEAAKDKTDSENTGERAGSNNGSISENADIAAFFGLTPLTVTYTGLEMCDSYPQNDGENYYFSMDASAGKKLMVLKFNLENPSDSDIQVDLLHQSAGFWVNFNGERKVGILATMLENDLATYDGTVAAGGTQEVVLVLELKEEDAQNTDSMILIMKNSEKTAQTNLQ